MYEVMEERRNERRNEGEKENDVVDKGRKGKEECGEVIERKWCHQQLRPRKKKTFCK